MTLLPDGAFTPMCVFNSEVGGLLVRKTVQDCYKIESRQFSHCTD